MNVTKNTKKIGALAVALMAGTAFLAIPAPAAHASEVIARDPAGVVIAQDQTGKLIAEPTAPRTITISAEPGTAVTLTPSKNTAKSSSKSTKNAKPRTIIANKDGKATFTKLTAGQSYTITADGQQTTATPVIKVGNASDLTVTTTDRVDTVDLTWAHQATKARGNVGYTVTATPATNNTNDDDPLQPITLETTSTSAELEGLNPTALYSFSVTPHNELGDGGASVARMNRSLADITGIAAPVAQQTPEQAPNQTPAQQPAAKPAAPAPAPGPAPAPKPSTRTILVCPDGYDDVNGVCTQTQDYTFTGVTETQPYTYRTEFVTTGWRVDPYPCSSGTMHPDGCWVAQGYNQEVTNPAPAGWTDNSSAYERTVQKKDDTPAGWADNGSAWVRTTAKIEKVVPA